MDKETCSPDSDRRDKAGLLEAARSLDASGLFAYWPRGDTGTSAATNALFGAYGAANPLTSGRGSYSMTHGNGNSSVSSAAYGNTLSVAASQAASLGINPASAAWWTMASHLAAQDYLARLHGMSFAGLPGAEALYPTFLSSHSGHGTSLSTKSSSKLNSSNSGTSMSSLSSKNNHSSLNSSHHEREKDKEKENWTSSEKDRDKDKGDREREKDKDRSREKDREKDRDKARDREKEKERDRDRDRDSSSNRSPMTAHSNSKVDHLSSIAALASSCTSVSAVPPQAHSGSSSDTSGILGGVRLPPDTEIIKYTSSIVGPKIPGTTNRGRKKTISLDPPSVSVMPTHSSTGIPIDLGQPFRSQLKSDSDSRDGSGDHIEVIKLPAHSASNGVVTTPSEPSDEVPLNLCTKSRGSDDLGTDKDRISRRKPVPKQRRPANIESNPITSLSAMSQLFASEISNLTPSSVEDDTEAAVKDGRPRNLGRGVSKPKKNTVASLLAQSRALGWKGSLSGDIASQIAALKGPLPSDITSQLALLQNLQTVVEEPDSLDKRSSTPDNSGIFDDKIRVRTSEDGSFTTDSTSTGGSDSESEHIGKTQKSKREKNHEGHGSESVKHTDKHSNPTKMKDSKYKDSKQAPAPTVEDRDSKRNSLMKEQLLYAQELNKQKELLYAVELEKERRRQHMTLVRALETRKRVEEREKKRIELRAEKIARQERKLEQRRVELELLKELRRPIEDMELDDLKAVPELGRIPGLKLSGQAFADTLMVFEFLHNFGETLGFDMESLPTLNSLQGALLNDEENEEELLSIMTHLLVCAIEDPGIPNPARHITLLGQSLKQADITHTNISEILRIYLYANATGEVKALTGLNFERDREKKISEHHNLYGEEAQNQHCGKNAAFFEHLYENSTYKLSEELKEKPFLALNPTTKSAILAFLCNELLQNKAVLRQIEGSLETVILSRRERWVLDQSIRKLRGLHDRQIRYNLATKDRDGVLGLNQQVNVNYKEKTNDGVDSEVESTEESDHESECIQPEEEDQQNLNTDEINKRLEKLIKQQEGYLSSLRTSNQQIRAMCLGQDRFWRRYWCLPTCGSIFVEGMESAQPEEYAEGVEQKEVKMENEEGQNLVNKSNDLDKDKICDEKENGDLGVHDGEDRNKGIASSSGDTRRRPGKRKGRRPSKQGKKIKLDCSSTANNNSDEEMSDNEETSEEGDKKKSVEHFTIETDLCNNNETSCNMNNNSNSDSDNKCADDFSGVKNDVENHSARNNESNTDPTQETETGINEIREGHCEAIDPSTKEESSDEAVSEARNVTIKTEAVENLSDGDGHGTESTESSVPDKGLNCMEENVKQEVKPEDVKKEKDAKVGSHEFKDYLKLYGEPLKNYSDHMEELNDKEFSDNPKESNKYLTEKRFKFEEEDPLLKAMKNELSTRIFGSPSLSYNKKEDFEDPHLLRNTASPLANGDKFPGFDLLASNYNLLRESDSESQWFSLLPKESCDPNTVIFGKSETDKMLLPLYLPTRGGLPPSPGPLPPCDSPAPLILSPEEAAMLEYIKMSGPKPPPVRKPVPTELRRGWWRITEEDQLYKILECLHGRGVRERELKRMLTRYLDNGLETGGKSTMFKPPNDLVDLDSKEVDGRIKFLEDGAPMTDARNSWDQSVAQRVENLMLEQVENLEDKVANASMQVKGWKVPSRSSHSETDDGECEAKTAKLEPVEIAKERLIALEAAIERRYLKPPLGFSTAEGGIIQAEQDESIPKGLGVWREAVLKSHTAAQLSMALYMLESCIAWDKSIMKANCQFCQSGDNEDKLLLCDGCDRGYHMYCFKPKMDTIPEGDWYCHECKNKANGERNCIVCGKRPVKNFVLCEHCPRAYHADCLNPPLLKIPRTKWNCANCAIKFPKKKCGRKLGWRKNKDMKTKDDLKDQKDHSNSGNDDKANEGSEGESDGEDLPLSSTMVTSKEGKEKECIPLSPIPSASSMASSNSALNDDPPPLSPQQPTTAVSKKERISKKLCKDLNACKTLIEEMESQDEAWPFLLPVNTKQFPTYRKIIKCPMDISTIKKRLTDGQYKTKEEFVYDVRQIFNNCETFNEDDSPVGKAGHAMRSFFETRWGELTNQKPTP